MSDLFILDARNVLLTLFEYRRAVLLKNHRKKSRKRRCYLVLLFLTDVKVTSFLGASLSLGRLSSSPPPVAYPSPYPPEQRQSRRLPARQFVFHDSPGILGWFSRAVAFVRFLEAEGTTVLNPVNSMLT